MTRTKSHSNIHGYPTPIETTSPCDTQPTQPRPRSPTLTPHRDAFLHHLWGGVARYSVWEIAQTNESEGLGEKEAEPYSLILAIPGLLTFFPG